jgi:hypothetical protein
MPTLQELVALKKQAQNQVAEEAAAAEEAATAKKAATAQYEFSLILDSLAADPLSYLVTSDHAVAVLAKNYGLLVTKDNNYDDWEIFIPHEAPTEPATAPGPTGNIENDF